MPKAYCLIHVLFDYYWRFITPPAEEKSQTKSQGKEKNQAEGDEKNP